MKKIFVVSVLALLMVTGCSATNNTVLKADPRMADCNLAGAVDDRGPIKQSLYVFGTFPDGQWVATRSRMMNYKGNGIYQAVNNEDAGNVSIQFATMNWNPQFTAAGMKLTVNEPKELKRGGFAKDTVINLPSAGKYVWSVKFSADKKPLSVMVSQCK